MSNEQSHIPETFIRRMANEIPLTLFLKWNDRAASDAVRKRAALLWLHGGGLCFWRLSKSSYAAACDVAGAKSNGSAIRSVKKPKAAPSAAACAQACADLLTIFGGEGDDNAKANAVETFFLTVGWITPDELLALVEEQELA